MTADHRGHPERRFARILAMQTLCQLDAQGDAFLAHIDRFLIDALESPDIITLPPSTNRAELRPRAIRLARDTWESHERYNDILKATVANWQPERLAMVDRALLRLALHEILDEADVPPKAAIDEAIELAKVFGGPDSPRFVNGVLDAAWRAHQTGGIAPVTVAPEPEASK